MSRGRAAAHRCAIDIVVCGSRSPRSILFSSLGPPRYRGGLDTRPMHRASFPPVLAYTSRRTLPPLARARIALVPIECPACRTHRSHARHEAFGRDARRLQRNRLRTSADNTKPRYPNSHARQHHSNSSLRALSVESIPRAFPGLQLAAVQHQASYSFPPPSARFAVARFAELAQHESR